MKPIKLTMTGFGPFAKSEEIDFTEIEKEPVFLICGPTGAGKTTIFDAVSYALFGEASGEGRKPDYMRSDFADVSITTKVELEFEVRGKKYYIMRQPRQTRPKKSGEGFTEVPAKVELTYTDGQNSDYVFTRHNEIAEKIKEIIGLGAEQFKQIIMLPQGEFRKLLTADSKQREEILRDIFDAEQYHRFQLRLKEESDRLEREIKEIRSAQKQWVMQIQTGDKSGPEESGFTDEAEAEEDDLVNRIKREEIDFVRLFQALEKQNAEDLQKAEEKKTNAIDIAKKIDELKAELFRRQKENEALAELRKVQELQTELASRQGYIKQTEEEVRIVHQAILLRPYAEYLTKLEQRKKEAAKDLDRRKRKNQEAEAAYEKVKVAYQQIKTAEWKTNLEKLEQELSELSGQLPLMKKLIILKREYMLLNKQYKRQEEELKQITESKQQTADKIKEMRQFIGSLEGIEEKKLALEQAILRFEKIKDLTYKFHQLKIEQKQHDKSFAEQEKQEQELEALYQAELVKIKANHVLFLRKDLKDGDTCPVCLGHYHTQALGEEHDHSERDIAELEAKRADLQKKREVILRKKAECDTKIVALTEQLVTEAKIGQAEEVLQIPEIQEQEYLRDKAKLEKVRQQITELKRQKESLSASEEELERIQNREVQVQNELAEQQTKRSVAAGEGKALKENILPEYQEKTSPEEIKAFEERKAALQAEKQEKTAYGEKLEEQYQSMITRQAEEKSALQMAQAQYTELTAERQAEKKRFEDKLEAAGFADEAVWQSYIAKEPKVKAMELEINDFKEQWLKNTDLAKRLLGEVKIKEYHNLQEMSLNITETEAARERFSEESVLLVNRAAENQKILNQLRAMEKQREQQFKEYSEISAFSKVANGDNAKKLTFERYVLAAFLEDVLAMANLRLNKMTGRYTLKRKEEVTHRGRQSGLEIEVFDAFTGKTRDINTLSGGEGFKASLAMALGLSEVVSSYAGGIELDMLFIDEGFGTLDPESLDSAIDCIMDLQARGKIIGIISHVQELKERIAAKLEVFQTPQGSYTRYHVGELH